MDLLDEITRHLCVPYEISLAADGKFGSQNGDDWTGIIGDVVNGVILNAKFNSFFTPRVCINISINVKVTFCVNGDVHVHTVNEFHYLLMHTLKMMFIVNKAKQRLTQNH